MGLLTQMEIKALLRDAESEFASPIEAALIEVCRLLLAEIESLNEKLESD